MPSQKRARSEPAEPAPELTTSTTAAKKVSMTATLDAMPHCRTKAEVIAAIESHLVPSGHSDGTLTRLEVSRFPEKYRKYLNKALRLGKKLHFQIFAIIVPNVDKMFILVSKNRQIYSMMLVKNQNLHEMGRQKSFLRFE